MGDEFLDVEKMKKYEGLLEKKWTSVVRLQKKVCRTSAGAIVNPGACVGPLP